MFTDDYYYLLESIVARKLLVFEQNYWNYITQRKQMKVIE